MRFLKKIKFDGVPFFRYGKRGETETLDVFDLRAASQMEKDHLQAEFAVQCVTFTGNNRSSNLLISEAKGITKEQLEKSGFPVKLFDEVELNRTIEIDADILEALACYAGYTTTAEANLLVNRTLSAHRAGLTATAAPEGASARLTSTAAHESARARLTATAAPRHHKCSVM